MGFFENFDFKKLDFTNSAIIFKNELSKCFLLVVSFNSDDVDSDRSKCCFCLIRS